MKILIDADGCPVTKITVKFAAEKNIDCIIVCDNAHDFFDKTAEVITVDTYPDSADYRLVKEACTGDIVITQDYGLAAMCLAKKCRVLNQNGTEYTDENISGLLNVRYENRKQLIHGKHIKGPRKRTRTQNDDFLRSLEKIITDI